MTWKYQFFDIYSPFCVFSWHFTCTARLIIIRNPSAVHYCCIPHSNTESRVQTRLSESRTAADVTSHSTRAPGHTMQPASLSQHQVTKVQHLAAAAVLLLLLCCCCMSSQVGEGQLSLLLTWRGSHPDLRPVLFISHTDVVPVDNNTLKASLIQTDFVSAFNSGCFHLGCC